MPRPLNKALFCHCGLPKLITGKCEYECSPWSDPDHLRLQARKRQEREAHRRREERPFITADDHKRMNVALSKFDPWYRQQARRGKMAAMARYRVGGAR